MKKLCEKIYIVLTLAILAGIFCNALYGSVLKTPVDMIVSKIREIRAENVGTYESHNTSVDTRVDWIDLYPYDESFDLVSVEEMQDTNAGKNTAYFDKYKYFFSILGHIGDDWAGQMIYHAEMVDVGNYITSLMTDSSSVGRYCQIGDGYWIMPSMIKYSESQAEEKVKCYYYLNNYLQDKEVPFLYCSVPIRECYLENNYPMGKISYTNDNIDSYISALDKFGIDNIDLRKNLHSDGKDHYKLFYKTDHHWNHEAGKWAANVLESAIKDRYEINIISTDNLGEYRLVVYDDAMFGSYGNAISHRLAKSEDFAIYFPEFDTSFRIEIPDEQIDMNGSFEKLFLDYTTIDKCIEEGGGYAYESIMYGNRPYVKIVNLLNDDGPKVLVIRDSFGSIVAPYLALACSELVLIDTRESNGNFSGSVINCINQSQPDIVLAIQSEPQNIRLK